MSSQPTRSHVQPHTAPRLDVVPDYEKLLILDRSDESLFEAVDLEQNQNQDALHSLSGANHCPHARSRSSTGNSPSSTIMKSSSNRSSANASPTRQPLHDGNGPSNRERQASNSLAPAPVRLAQAQVSLSWTDILRPLMDDDSHRLDKITAPLGVQNQPPQATSPSSGEDNLQDLTSSGHSKLSASAPASRAGTIRRDRSRSPSRDRAHSHATQQPPSTVLGVMADGRVASPKVSTRRERSPSTWASPDASLTQDLQPTLMTKTRQQHQQQPSQNLAQWQQQQQRQQSGSLTAESRTQGVISSDRDQYQQQQTAANRIVGTASTQNPLLLSDDSNNSSPPSPTSSRRDYPKEIQPKVDTWRVESPTARRRAQEAAEREAQRQREEQAQREMEEFHRQQLERMREAERRRKVDAETHVCSLDFLVSVGSEAKQPEEPPSPTVKQVQPKVDTWWREGRPRSPTMERANRPQLAALSNSLQQSAPLPATSNSSAQAGESTTSPSRTRKTWGTVAASSVGTSNTNRNASIDDGDSGARQQQQSPTKSWGGQQQSQQAQLAQMQATRQHQPAVQRPPSPQQSRQTLARPPSPSQPRAAMGNKLTVNVNNTSEQSNMSSPPSPNRKPRSPRPANLTIETTQHPTLSRQPPQQQQAASPPKSASLSRASARKVAAQLSETLDSAIVASATSPATRALPSRSRTTSANATTVSQLDESHGPTRAFLQRQSQNSLNDHGAAPPSPTSAKRQASSTLLVPQSPGGTLQRSRKSSSASVNNVSFANGAGDSLAAMLRKQQRELGTVTNMGGAGGPPAVLTIQARSWRSYLMHEGAYVALLAVFLLMAFETLAGDYGRGYKVGCIKTARHLSNTGEVVCHD